MAPAVAPDIIMAIGLLGLYPPWVTLGLHSVLCRTSSSARRSSPRWSGRAWASSDPSLEEASRDLGAGRL